MIPRHRLPLLTTASCALAAHAFAQIELPADHVDLGIGFHDGALELHWHLEDLELEYAPAEAYVFIPLSSAITRPAGTEWDFTGAIAGATVYLAPAIDQTPSVIFLGIGSEEILSETLVANTVTLALTGISGPGNFALWQTDGLGQPTAFLSSASELSSFDLITGGHDHYNWGFTAEGIYELTFTVSGILNDDFDTSVSDTATFTFAVGTPIPEPSAFAVLAGLAGLGLAISARRRR